MSRLSSAMSSQRPPHQWRLADTSCLDDSRAGRIHRKFITPRGTPSYFKAGVVLLFAAILAGPMTTVLSKRPWVAIGVFAEPCVSKDDTSVDLGREAVAKQVVVSAASENLLHMFDCEDGVFEVDWSGEVGVPGTIVIGEGTTVRIVGTNASVTEGSTSESSSNASGSEELEELTSGLPLPHGLTSAAVGLAFSVNSAHPDLRDSMGPIFSVKGGQLFLEDMMVRGGFADSGAGVYAKQSNVSIIRCEFIDSCAEISGGGIYVEESVLNVTSSIFSNCRAGYSSFSEEDAEGKGGGIHAKTSEVLIDECLFEGCFAGNKGGGLNLDAGHLSVLDSVFYNNVALSGNKEDDDQEGRGGDLLITKCNHSFDGQAACGANDTFFVNAHAGRKGGAVTIENGNPPSHVEFHRCTVGNSSAGSTIKDDSAGDGGAFSVGKGDTLVLADCIVKNNTCGTNCAWVAKTEDVSIGYLPQTARLPGPVTNNCAHNSEVSLLSPFSRFFTNQTSWGGAIELLSGSDAGSTPGASVILINSTFQYNKSEAGKGGVVYLGDFANATVQGDGNVFEANTCGINGAVFALATGALVTVEGGSFTSNRGKNGGVFWSRGDVIILGGDFLRNEAEDDGGVLCATESNTTVVEGGHFEGNEAFNGGVGIVGDGASLTIQGGNVTGNVAHNEGGAFSVAEGGNIKTRANLIGTCTPSKCHLGDGILVVREQITGGFFSKNEAEYGGFLNKRGGGNASCTGASIQHNRGLDGGAIYAVDGANIIWACDIADNSALSGPAIYARDNTTVTLREMSLVDNKMLIGSVIVIMNSHLDTHKVEFRDSAGSGRSAHIVFEGSSYMAEDTSFVGYMGEAVVSSQGDLFLDNCDFSGSTSSKLISSESTSTSVVRNAILGDSNYLPVAEASSKAGQLPTANFITHAIHTCKDLLEVSGGEQKSPISSQRSLCSEGSACLDGDLGVYCECYYPQRTISSSKQRCVSGDAAMLVLTLEEIPEGALFPELVEGDLRVSYNASASQAQVSSSSSSSSSGGLQGNGDGAVVWTVEALQTSSLQNWTIFPSTGLLLPGNSNTIRVVTQPSEAFDGTANVTFSAIDGFLARNMSAVSTINGDNDGHVQINYTQAHQAPGESDVQSSPGELSGGVVGEVSFGVTFYHCEAGRFWELSDASGNDSDGSGGSCRACTEEIVGMPEGVDCANAGMTIRTLPIKAGYWRATLDEILVRKCFSEDACKGGTKVAAVDEYCGEGYEGPQCTVCSSGYGRGGANQCRACSEGFKIGMYFLGVVFALVAAVMTALLVVYLIRGMDAVSSTVASTKEAVLTLKRRRAGFSSSTGGGNLDFGPLHTRSGRTNVSTSDSVDDSNCVGVEMSTNVVRGTTSVRDKVLSYDYSNGRFQDSGKGIYGMRGLSAFFGTSRGAKTAPAETCSSLALANRRQEQAGGYAADAGVSDSPTIGESPPEVLSGRACAGEHAHLRAGNVGVGGREKPAGATKIGETLAALPLSKVKIVIVVWQISTAFAQVTGAGFPPIYEKFLAVIGLFSMDLGWVLSAACLATDLTFYHKLLIVTIGPLVLLGLLGITFWLGSSSTQPPVAEEPVFNTSSWVSRASEDIVPEIPSRETSRDTSGEYIPISRHDMPYSKVGAMPAQGLAFNSTWLAGVQDSGASLGPVVKNDQACWMIDVGDESAAKSGRNSSSATGPTGQPILSRRRSLWKKWQAGSGRDPKQNQLWGLFSRHTTMALIILYLVYSTVSTVLFQTFACEDYPEINKRYLRADSRIECDTPTHREYEIYAAIMIFLYPLGIPAVFGYLLVRQTSSINPPTDKGLDDSRGPQGIMREKIERRRTNKSISPTSFLWGAYYPNRHYFEVFECLRRLLLTGVLVFVPDKSGQAAAYGCIFAFLSLCAFELQRPHIDNLETQLYRTGCMVIFFTNFLALIIQVELAQADSSSSAIYSVILITVHVLIVVSIWWNSWATIKAAFSRRHIQSLVLGVDVVSEERADKLLGAETAKGYKGASRGNLDAKAEEKGTVLSTPTQGMIRPPSFEPSNMRIKGVTGK